MLDDNPSPTTTELKQCGKLTVKASTDPYVAEGESCAMVSALEMAGHVPDVDMEFVEALDWLPSMTRGAKLLLEPYTASPLLLRWMKHATSSPMETDPVRHVSVEVESGTPYTAVRAVLARSPFAAIISAVSVVCMRA